MFIGVVRLLVLDTFFVVLDDFLVECNFGWAVVLLCLVDRWLV